MAGGTPPGAELALRQRTPAPIQPSERQGSAPQQSAQGMIGQGGKEHSRAHDTGAGGEHDQTQRDDHLCPFHF